MIRIRCSSCGSKLNAKEKLIGQTRPCPKCGQPIMIIAPEGTDAAPSIPLDEPDAAQLGLIGNKQTLPSQHVLKRLDRQNRYWICDHAHIIAAWANDGKGWMLKTNAGMVNATRNRDQVPNQGNYVLVELKMEIGAEGLRLRGIATYQLPPRWALPAITEGDDRICEKVTGYGSLSKEQKGVIRMALREQFMHEIWEGATKVLEYLHNADYHSHVVADS